MAGIVTCRHCFHQVPVDADGRWPPWCPQCGKNLKRDSATKAVPLNSPGAGVTTTAAEHAGQSLALGPPAPDDDALRAFAQSIHESHRDPAAERTNNRIGGLQLVLAGLIAVAGSIGVSWLSLFTSGGQRMTITIGLLGMGVVAIFAGLFSLITGRKLITAKHDAPAGA